MTVHKLLLAELEHRICGENIPRIKKCLGMLSQEQIWHKPNAELVSIGNLVLHLHGNARQWILHTLCGIPYQRNRDAEFETQGPLPKEELYQLLDKLDEDIKQSVWSIQEPDLLSVFEVQIFKETGVAVLVHAIEHFSYHTGQIARETKRMLAKDLGFYDDAQL